MRVFGRVVVPGAELARDDAQDDSREEEGEDDGGEDEEDVLARAARPPRVRVARRPVLRLVRVRGAGVRRVRGVRPGCHQGRGSWAGEQPR